MRRRRSLIARLDRLDPPAVGGGVLYAEDLLSGLVPPNCATGAGFLLVGRAKKMGAWLQTYAPDQVAGWIARGRIAEGKSWP
ncbi:MAG: hypothetical protein ABL970_00980 [Nitrospira sp.]